MSDEKQCEATDKSPLTEVGEAHAIANELHRFNFEMLEKLQCHQGDPREHSWNDDNWRLKEIKLEIQRCLEDNDFVSAANYCMFARYYIKKNKNTAGITEMLSRQAAQGQQLSGQSTGSLGSVFG